jgi:hypothetical protein
LLFSQYLHSRSQGHVARVIDEQLLGRTRSEARHEEIEAVERALLGRVAPHLIRLLQCSADVGADGDFGSIEGLIAQPGLLRPQTQKAFLYMCYRQQFLEHVENRESLSLHSASSSHPAHHVGAMCCACSMVVLIVHRRVSESVQPPSEAAQASRALPTCPIRFLQPRVPHLGVYGPRRSWLPRLGRRGAGEGTVNRNVEGVDAG